MRRNFFLVGSPRCRTAWFSAYFTACGTHCYHDFYHISSIFDLESNNPYQGISSPNPFQDWDSDKLVVIHRPIEEVYESMAIFLREPTEEFLNAFWHALPEVESKLNSLKGLHVDYKDIDSRIEEIHLKLMPKTLPFSSEIYRIFKGLNIQSTDRG